jgi:hypothetical protein
MRCHPRPQLDALMRDIARLCHLMRECPDSDTPTVARLRQQIWEGLEALEEQSPSPVSDAQG